MGKMAIGEVHIWVLRFSRDQYHSTIAPDSFTDPCATEAMQSQQMEVIKQHVRKQICVRI
jgi:hypothetical protein